MILFQDIFYRLELLWNRYIHVILKKSQDFQFHVFSSFMTKKSNHRIQFTFWGLLKNERLNKYCSQDWASDFFWHQDNVSVNSCRQKCVSSTSCTGISWASEDNGATNRCVLCHGTMQYGTHPNWITYDIIDLLPSGKIYIYIYIYIYI